tara:strand:+ start:597 stop:791 length:195 start_codon:yes stop_codon:yes gene_type:complete
VVAVEVQIMDRQMPLAVMVAVEQVQEEDQTHYQWQVQPILVLVVEQVEVIFQYRLTMERQVDQV